MLNRNLGGFFYMGMSQSRGTPAPKLPFPQFFSNSLDGLEETSSQLDVLMFVSGGSLSKWR